MAGAAHAWCRSEGTPGMSSRALAATARELTGVASPSEMIRSNQRTYCPSLGLLADAETEATA
jgi:hypothetical protein